MTKIFMFFVMGLLLFLLITCIPSAAPPSIVQPSPTPSSRPSMDRRLLTEWVAREKYWITLNPRPEMTEPFMEMGYPLAFVTPREGDYVTSAGGNITVINKAPHPNAAKLFVNWLLSQEGSALWSKTHVYQSARLDVSSNHLKLWYLREAGKKYFDGDTEDWEDKMVRSREQLQNIYAPLLSK